MNSAEQAAAQMKAAFETHTEEYRTEMQEKVKRFTRANPELLEQYRKLTDNLMNDTFVKQQYHWETNTISPV